LRLPQMRAETGGGAGYCPRVRNAYRAILKVPTITVWLSLPNIVR